MRRVDLHRIIAEAAELLQLEAEDSVGITQDFDPSIPPINGDASALRQLFINLVRNAHQAHATAITLRSRVEHGVGLLKEGVTSVVRLDVEDNGDGVPESLRDLLFLPLVTGRRDGTGLGLALAQQVAAAHSGLLTFSPLPQGSRFTLKLPLEPAGD
jgi:two-component system nitrogen regulation sensor histidine kinase GlnL